MLFSKFLRQVRKISTTPPQKSLLRTGFKAAFGKYLYITNTATSGVLMGVGDIIQQEVEFRKKKLPKRYDWKRLERMFYVGLALGPLHHIFYKYLDKFLPKKTMHSIGQKILYDQIIMSPVCIATFFYGMGLLEKKSLQQCTTEIKAKGPRVYMVDWILWPPTQMYNFYYVPVKYQVFYVNFVTMLYNVFLSFMKHKEVAEERGIAMQTEAGGSQTINPQMINPQMINPQINPQSVNPQIISPQVINPQIISQQTVNPQTLNSKTLSPQT